MLHAYLVHISAFVPKLSLVVRRDRMRIPIVKSNATRADVCWVALIGLDLAVVVVSLKQCEQLTLSPACPYQPRCREVDAQRSPNGCKGVILVNS